MKPIFPTEGMTILQKQRCGLRYTGLVLKNMSPFLKGTGWKKNSAWVFKAYEDWYFTTFITGGYMRTNDELAPMRVRSQFGVKPLTVDNIFWKTQGRVEDVKNPLSWRSNGVGIVSALTISTLDVAEEHTNVVQSAKHLVDLILQQETAVKNIISNQPFSEVIKQHGKDKTDGPLFWISLISEGRGPEAVELIKEHYLGSKDKNDFSSEKAYKTVIGWVKSYEDYVRNN